MNKTTLTFFNFVFVFALNPDLYVLQTMLWNV